MRIYRHVVIMNEYPKINMHIMKNIVVALLVIIFMTSCNTEKIWVEDIVITLGDIKPIGLTYFDNTIWIADGDQNKVVKLSQNGEVIKTYTDFDRPMHITSDENRIYIPEYGSDRVIKLEEDQRSVLSIGDSLDAPAGVAVYKNEIAIADFYNHRVLFFDGTQWNSIGSKGKEEGEFHYPTDVQVTSDKVFVADAYNHRVQVFDKQGKFLMVFGETEKINAATGLFVSDRQIFVTDFENSRVLIYNLEGDLNQIINSGLNKPTDIIMIKEDLYISNYEGKSLNKYILLKKM